MMIKIFITNLLVSVVQSTSTGKILNLSLVLHSIDLKGVPRENFPAKLAAEYIPGGGGVQNLGGKSI